MSERQASLQRFVQALYEALNSVPAGYPDAAEDRNRFCAPVEQVIQAVQETITALIEPVKLSCWVPPIPPRRGNATIDALLVRYPDPLDGQTWSLDGTPRWIACVTSCCGPSLDEPQRPFHYDWSVEYQGCEKDNTVSTSFEDACAEADAYMRGLGWELVDA